MEHGFIYKIANYIIEKLKWLNLVELFKFVAKKMNSKNAISHVYSRISVDIFITLKWLLIVWIWLLKIRAGWLNIFVWYLIVSNIYTYFYYHVWCDEALNTESFDKDRMRRRFVALFLALSYSNLCFAYLYSVPYAIHFDWTTTTSSLHALWFSISNSLAANYDFVKPLTGLGNSVAMVQLMITFIFVTIIISRSIPQTSSNK